MSKFPWTRQLFRVNDYQDLVKGKLYEFETRVTGETLFAKPSEYSEKLTELEQDGFVFFLESFQEGWCKVVYKDMVGYLQHPKLFRIVEGVERVK